MDIDGAAVIGALSHSESLGAFEDCLVGQLIVDAFAPSNDGLVVIDADKGPSCFTGAPVSRRTNYSVVDVVEFSGGSLGLKLPLQGLRAVGRVSQHCGKVHQDKDQSRSSSLHSH